MITKEATLKSRYVFKLAANVVNGLVNIAIVAIVPKALGAVNYGVFTYLQQFYLQILGFLDAGSSIAFFTKLSANRDRRELITFYGIISIFLLGLVVCFTGLLKFTHLGERILPEIPKEFFFLGMILGYLIWLIQVMVKIADAYALTKSVETIKIVHRIGSFALLIIIIACIKFNLTIFYFYQLLISFIFIVLSFIILVNRGIINKSLWKKLPFRNLCREFTEFITPLFAYNVLAGLIGVFDLWLLQEYFGSAETGYYGLAFQIAAMCFIFTSAMTPVITREFAKSYAEKDIPAMGRLFSRYIPMLYSIASFLGIFITFHSSALISVISGEGFDSALGVVAVMGFYPIHQTYGQLSGSIFMPPEKPGSLKILVWLF